MAGYAGAFWRVWLELAPWLLFGTLVAALMHVLIPAGFVKRQFRGGWGVFKAVALGIPLPLCSCGVIPAAVGLKKDGASTGPAIGFLISTPQTGVDSIAVSASMLGWPFALFKLGSALVTGVAGGWLSDALEPAPQDRAATPAAATDTDPGATLGDQPGRFARAWSHGIQILRSIWRWLLLGVLVSAAITTFLPKDFFAGLPGGVLGASLAMLLASLPLYVCATASVPIAAAMVASGLPTGAALVFLMAGPASNVATIGTVYRTFGGRALASYLASIVVGSLTAALTFDFIIDTEALPLMAEHVHHSPWALVSALILAALLAWFALQELHVWLTRRRAASSQAPTLEVAVRGMTCGGCANRLGQALRGLDGVQTADVSFDTGRAVIHGSIGHDELGAAIRRAGYDVADPLRPDGAEV